MVLVIASIASSFWLWGSVIYMVIAPSAGLSFSATNEDFLFYGQYSKILEIFSLSGNWAVITRVTNIGDFIYGNSLARVTLLLPLLVLLWSIVKAQTARNSLSPSELSHSLPSAPLNIAIGPVIDSLGYVFPISLPQHQKFVGAL